MDRRNLSLKVKFTIQQQVRDYIERWGIQVHDGGLRSDALNWRSFSVNDPQGAGIYIPNFAVDCPNKENAYPEHSAVDLVRSRIYFPTAAEPYMLLHEYAHLMVYYLTGAPPDYQVEFGLLSALEYQSVVYLATAGGNVSLEDWVQWRCDTSFSDAKSDLIDEGIKRSEELIDMCVFYRRGDAVVPTYLPFSGVPHRG